MTGPQDFNDQNRAAQDPGLNQQPSGQQHVGQPGSGQQYPSPQYPGQQQFAQPGFAPAPPPRQKSQIGARLMAFALRDVPALVAGGVTAVMGLLLLVTPHLPWLKDNSFDVVEGTMTISARGRIGISSAAQRGLSDADALELGFLEIMYRILSSPLAGMLTLSAILVLVGGLLMITTARQLGAVVALAGVIPQIIITVIGVMTIMLTADSSPDAADSGTLDTGISAGAGFYLTVAAYVIVIICAALAAIRREAVLPPAPAPAHTAGPVPDPPTGPMQQPPGPMHPPTGPMQQPPDSTGQPPAGS